MDTSEHRVGPADASAVATAPAASSYMYEAMSPIIWIALRRTPMALATPHASISHVCSLPCNANSRVRQATLLRNVRPVATLRANAASCNTCGCIGRCSCTFPTFSQRLSARSSVRGPRGGMPRISESHVLAWAWFPLPAAHPGRYNTRGGKRHLSTLIRHQQLLSCKAHLVS